MTRIESKQKSIQFKTDKPVSKKNQQTRLRAENRYNQLAALINQSFALIEISNHRNPTQVRYNIS